MGTTPDVSLKLSADGTAVVAELKKVRGEVETFGKGVQSAAALAIAAFSVDAIAGFANELINAADQLGDTAQRLDVAAESLQSLRLAAEDFGSSADAMDRALGELQVRLGKAAEEGGSAAAAFERIGLSAEQLASVGADEALLRISDAMQNTRTQAEAAALAQEFFGKSGKELVPLLKEGREGLSSLAGEYKALGLVLSNDTIDKLSQTEKALRDAKTATKNLGSELLGLAAPGITAAANFLTEFVGGLKVLAGIDLSRVEQLDAEIDRIRRRIEPAGSEFNKNKQAIIDGLLELQRFEFDRERLAKNFNEQEAEYARRRHEQLMNDLGLNQIINDVLNTQFEIKSKTAELESAAATRTNESQKTDSFSGNSINANGEFDDSQLRIANAQAVEQALTDAAVEGLNLRLAAASSFNDLYLQLTGQRIDQEISLESAKNESMGSLLGGLLAAVGSHNERVAKLAQNLSIAQTIWQGTGATIKALNEVPYPANFGVAAGIALQTATAVARIKATKYGGSTVSGGTAFVAGASGGATGTPQNDVFNPANGQSAFEKRAIRVELVGELKDNAGRVFAGLLAKEIKDNDVVIIDPTSRQATELQG